MIEPREVAEWKLICDLGTGAFGKVSLWKNRISQEQIAVKKCKKELAKSVTPRQKERWINEVDIMKSLDNTNIVAYKPLPPVIHAALYRHNPTGLPILSMEYCGKGNLRKFLQQPRNLRGCDEDDVRCILADLSNAISYLHERKITHRDIKPENIVIQGCDTRPGKNIYKVIDLGYAKELDTIASFVGTLPYLAPEIFKNKPYDHTVDYWSLGVLTYEIVTGFLPFLPSRTPVERFKYLQEKSDDDIAISMTKHDVPKYSSEIALDNRLCPTFKRDLETWLRLLLRYKYENRGRRNGVTTNVFNELQTVLNRKILKVFSVFGYRRLDYVVVRETKLSDVRSYVEKNFGISWDSQIFVTDAECTILDDTVDMMDLFCKSTQRTIYVFKKRCHFEPRIVNVPKQVQLLLESRNLLPDVLKVLYVHAMAFARDEKQLMEDFDAGVMAQCEHCLWLSNQMTQQYSKVRANLIRLITEIELHREHASWQQGKLCSNEEVYLKESRKYLRQAKELVECFNGLTERYLKILKTGNMANRAEYFRKMLCLNETTMAKLYDSSVKAYQRFDPSTNCDISEMDSIIHEVLKTPRKEIFSNEELKSNLKSSLSIRGKLEKLLKWSEAIETAIVRVATDSRECEKKRYINNFRKTEGNLKLSFRDDLEDMMSVDELLSENMTIRYRMQEICDENSRQIREISRDLYKGSIFV